MTLPNNEPADPSCIPDPPKLTRSQVAAYCREMRRVWQKRRQRDRFEGNRRVRDMIRAGLIYMTTQEQESSNDSQ